MWNLKLNSPRKLVTILGKVEKKNGHLTWTQNFIFTNSQVPQKMNWPTNFFKCRACSLVEVEWS